MYKYYHKTKKKRKGRRRYELFQTIYINVITRVCWKQNLSKLKISKSLMVKSTPNSNFERAIP
jgi:hypothetical protein